MAACDSKLQGLRPVFIMSPTNPGLQYMPVDVQTATLLFASCLGALCPQLALDVDHGASVL
jgi:hypothetical protein